MGNKNVKYSEHSDAHIDNENYDPTQDIVPEKSANMSVGSGDNSVSPDVSVTSEAVKDPRSPTVEFTRTSFYSKIASRNDHAYSQLNKDSSQTSESFDDSLQESNVVVKTEVQPTEVSLPPVQPAGTPATVKQSFDISWSSKTNTITLPAPSTSEHQTSDVGSSFPADEPSDVDHPEHSMQSDITPSSASSRRKPFPRLAFGFSSNDRSPKYSPIHSSDE